MLHFIFNTRNAVILAMILLTGLVIAIIDLYPDLSHVDLTVLSGPKSGEKHHLVNNWKKTTSNLGGSMTNFSTNGVKDNLDRLNDPNDEVKNAFAIIPDGLALADSENFELIAKIPKKNYLIFLGREQQDIYHLRDFKGKKLGIGPEGSATDLLMRQLFVSNDLKGLNLKLSNADSSQQLNAVTQNQLDYAVLFVDKDNPIIRRAIESGLKIINFMNIKAWLNRYQVLKEGQLFAGEFDEVRLLPGNDKTLFQIDSMVISNQSVSRSNVVALLVILNKHYHGFIQYNRDEPNQTGIPLSQDAHNFFQHNGPNFMDEYLPGLVNFMPPANWLHFIVVISLLLNLLSGWNKLRLFLIDSKREKIENQIHALLAVNLIHKDSGKSDSRNFESLNDADKEQLVELIRQSEKLLLRCRNYAGSFVTPLGQENVYRYHEGLIKDHLSWLKNFKGNHNHHP